MAIFGFIGNYFWTHYFFNLLGAAYTLPSHRLNGVSCGAAVHSHVHKQQLHNGQRPRSQPAMHT
jgi:cycloeucalenol cycloisomerase